MFVLQQEREFWWPVKVEVPIDNKHETKQFRVKLKLMTRTRFARLFEELGALNDEEALVEKLRELVLDWANLVDPAGIPVPFTTENFVALLEIPYVTPALVQAIRTAFSPPAKEQRRLGN